MSGRLCCTPCRSTSPMINSQSCGSGCPALFLSNSSSQRRLYAVCEGKFGLHADSRDAFGPDEINEQPIPEDRAHQDANGVKDNSTFQTLHVRWRGRMKRDTNPQPQAGQRQQDKDRDETTQPLHAGRKSD